MYSLDCIVITNFDASARFKRKFLSSEKVTNFQEILHFGFGRLEYLIQFEIGADQYVCVNSMTPSAILFEL